MTAPQELAPIRPQAARKSGLRKSLAYLRTNWTVLLLALPGVVLIFLLRYIPILGVVVAFEDYQAEKGFLSSWVGLRNFRLLWTSPSLWRIVRNTLSLNIMFIVAGTVSAVVIALLLNEIRSSAFKRVSQSLMFLPYFMGWAIVSMILYGLTDYRYGMLNAGLTRLGLEPVSLYNDPAPWPWILTIIRIWKGAGSGCIVYLAVLAGINPELYEAAAMDGADRLRRIWYISRPMLTPTIILLTLLAIGGIFYGDFGMIYALIGERANLFPTTDVIDTYIIRGMQTYSDFGVTTAIGLSQSVLGFICVFGSNWLAKKWSQSRAEDYSLF